MCAGRSLLTGRALQLRPLLATGQLVGPLQVVLPFQIVGPLQVIRPLLVGPQLIALLLQGAALNVDLAADKLRRECLARKGAIPISLLWRNLQWHRCKPLRCAGRPGAHGETAGGAIEHAEPAAVAAKHLDASDPTVSVGVKLDGHAIGCVGRAILRNLDKTGGATNAKGRGRRIDLHVSGMRDFFGDEGGRTLKDVERSGVIAAALLIDEIIHRDLRIRFQREGGVVVEGNAYCAVGTRTQNVAFVDRVAQMNRSRRVVVSNEGAALQCRNAADWIGVLLLRGITARRLS